jgi:hypothetical protein
VKKLFDEEPLEVEVTFADRVLQDVPLVGFNHSSQWGYLTES